MNLAFWKKKEKMKMLKVQSLTEKTLNEKETEKVVTLYPELLIGDHCHHLGQKILTPYGELDLVLGDKKDNIYLVDCKENSEKESLSRLAYYYVRLTEDISELKTKLNLKGLNKIIMVMVRQSYDSWFLDYLNLFKDNLDLRLFTYEAYETGKDQLSVRFDEVHFKSDNIVLEEKPKSHGKMNENGDKLSENSGSLKEEQRVLMKGFLKSLEQKFPHQNIYGVSKPWGYILKKEKRTIGYLHHRKNYIKIEVRDENDQYIRGELNRETQNEFLTLFEQELKKVA